MLQKTTDSPGESSDCSAIKEIMVTRSVSEEELLRDCQLAVHDDSESGRQRNAMPRPQQLATPPRSRFGLPSFIRHEGVIDAGTHREALPQLTQRKLFPLEVQDQDAAKNPFGYRARTTLKSQD